MREYSRHGSLIIACDVDDTIFDFHANGVGHARVINLLKSCQSLGFHICLFTASPKSRWPEILAHAESLDLKIASINKNPIELKYGHDGKMYYNILLDDRAGLGQSCDILERVINQIRP